MREQGVKIEVERDSRTREAGEGMGRWRRGRKRGKDDSE